MKKMLLPLFLLIVELSAAQGIVKTMFYNVLNYPSAPPQNRELHLRIILDEYQPDIFMIAEVENATGALEILDQSLNYSSDQFAAAPFEPNTSSTWDDQLQQLLYYRTNTFNLVDTDIIQTNVRDINMYKLQLISQDGVEDVFFYVFVAHLKASDGDSNVQQRLQMVQEFTDYLATIPADSNVIFAGDFNFYTANEPGYGELLNLDQTNSITLSDPIDAYGDWHNNSSYTEIHTQSTRISNSGFDNYGAGGGLDDRFDFILVSENLMNENSDVHYVENSYEAFGNNGNCFNGSINNSNCDGEFSQTLRNALYNMSDHLPVVMELETNHTLSIPAPDALAQVTLLSGNVVNDFLELKIPMDLAGKKIAIYNTLGQKLQEVLPKNSLTVQLNVASLANGMYLVVFENSKIAPVKFIKTH